MKSMRTYLPVLGILAWPICAHADDDPNVVVMKKMYTKLGAIVGVGSNDTDDTFLVLANPGTLIDPRLDMTRLRSMIRQRLAQKQNFTL